MSHRFFWQFPGDHASLPGHFPGQPIAPGAVLLDRLALMARQVPPLADAGLRLEQVKFLQPCRPGDRLAFTFEARDAGGFSFRIERDEMVLVQGLVSPGRQGPA